eukprot:jgi/Ulvmu1/8971/UM005_0062.1
MIPFLLQTCLQAHLGPRNALIVQARQTMISSRVMCCGISPHAADHIDNILVKSLDLHHDVFGDYRQAVLIDGCSDRPFRLDWPDGTVVFMVGSTQQLTDSVSSHPAGMRKGCLLRRVALDQWETGRLEMALIEAGFQADKLSVWVLQAEDDWQVEGLSHAAAEVANCAALGSLVLGVSAGIDAGAVRNSLAESGLLGSVQSEPGGGASFTVQQQRPSLLQEGTYHRHVQAAEEADEDFFGNFS